MTREQFAALLRAMCERYNIHPRTAALLWRWARTEDGASFANGATLQLVFEPHKAKPRRKVEGSQRGLRPARMTLDWIDDDE